VPKAGEKIEGHVVPSHEKKKKKKRKGGAGKRREGGKVEVGLHRGSCIQKKGKVRKRLDGPDPQKKRGTREKSGLQGEDVVCGGKLPATLVGEQTRGRWQMQGARKREEKK